MNDSFTSIAMVLGALFAVSHSCLGFTDTVTLWNIRTVSVSEGKLSALVECHEAKYRKDIGDLLLAGRGTLSAKRNVYGVAEIQLDGKPSRKRHVIDYRGQDLEGQNLRGGFHGKPGRLIVHDPFSKWIAVSTPERTVPFLHVDLGNQRALTFCRSGSGAIPFHHGKDIWEYDPAATAWLRIGTIPGEGVDLLSGFDAAATDDTLGVVCEDQGVLCTWGARGLSETKVTAHSLDEGRTKWRIEQPAQYDFLGLMGGDDALLAVFVDRQGTVRLVDTGGTVRHTASLPSALFPVAAVTSPIGAVFSPCIVENRAAFLFVRLIKNGKKGTIHIWWIDSDGTPQARAVLLSLRLPPQDVPVVK